MSILIGNNLHGTPPLWRGFLIQKFRRSKKTLRNFFLFCVSKRFYFASCRLLQHARKRRFLHLFIQPPRFSDTLSYTDVRFRKQLHGFLRNAKNFHSSSFIVPSSSLRGPRKRYEFLGCFSFIVPRSVVCFTFTFTYVILL